MTTVVATHAVGDMDTWLAGGSERQELFKGFSSGVGKSPVLGTPEGCEPHLSNVALVSEAEVQSGRRNVRSWVLSGRNHAKSRHWFSNVRYWVKSGSSGLSQECLLLAKPGHSELFSSLHGGVDRGILAVLFDEKVGGAADIDVGGHVQGRFRATRIPLL